ncbi:MAG TPA: hypothetical protein V6D05_11925 [Stenomitos sp.]
MAKRWTCVILGVLLAGCQRAPQPPVTAEVPVRQAVVQQATAPLPDAPADVPLAQVEKAQAPQLPWDALHAIADQGGVVKGLTGLAPDEAPGQTIQIVPEDTQDNAQELAHAWQPDARQVYVGWGFWGISLLGKVRHVYYSPKTNRQLRLEYSFTKGRLERHECDGTDFKDAFLVLRDAYDMHPWQARDAYARAKRAGYRPGKYVTATLLHLVGFGPQWVFIEDTSWRPTVVVDADTGDVTTSGPLMWAVTYLVNRARPDGPPDPCSPDGTNASP